jgi:hypothetical protein
MKNIFYAVIAGFLGLVATNEIVAYKTHARSESANPMAVALAQANEEATTETDAYISAAIEAQYQHLALGQTDEPTEEAD